MPYEYLNVTNIEIMFLGRELEYSKLCANNSLSC